MSLCVGSKKENFIYSAIKNFKRTNATVRCYHRMEKYGISRYPVGGFVCGGNTVFF